MSDTSTQSIAGNCIRSTSDLLWAELVRRLQPVIAGAVSRCLRRFNVRTGTDLVDDLVQQTFVRLCDNQCRALSAAANVPEPAFLPYIRSVAANLTIDYVRRQKPSEEVREDMSSRDTEEDTYRSLLFGEIHRHLQGCTGDGGERDRRVFWYHYRLGLTTKAIAAMPALSLSESGVESVLFRLIRCLRAAMVQSEKKEKGNLGSSRKGGSAFGAATS